MENIVFTPLADALMSALGSCPQDWLQWQIRENDVQVFELFKARVFERRSVPECYREKDSSTVTLDLYTPHQAAGRMGHARLVLSPGASASEAVFRALDLARLNPIPAFTLPDWRGSEAKDGFFPGLDPESCGLHVLERAARLCEDFFCRGEKAPRFTLSSFEGFSRREETRTKNSRGLVCRDRRSPLDFELIVADDNTDRRFTYGATAFQADDFSKALAAFARQAELASGEAPPPPSGSMDLWVEGTFFTQAIAHLLAAETSALSLYSGTRRDQELGAAWQLSVDPHKRGLEGSRARDPDGLALHALDLWKNGKRAHTWGDLREAAKAQTAATGGITNLVFAGPLLGKDAHSAEAAHAQSGKPLLEVLEVASFDVESATGHVSAELRAGRLWQNGKAQPVRLGSFSFNFWEKANELRFSAESAPHESFHGPTGFFVPASQVTGK